MRVLEYLFSHMHEEFDKSGASIALRKQRTENIHVVLRSSEMEWCKLCLQIALHISVVVSCLYMLSMVM